MHPTPRCHVHAPHRDQMDTRRTQTAEPNHKLPRLGSNHTARPRDAPLPDAASTTSLKRRHACVCDVDDESTGKLLAPHSL
jgi:hypothetical protein